MTNSIGVIETKSVAFAGESLNRILKDKDIQLLDIEFPGEGLITVFLLGEYSKMKNALQTAGDLSVSFKVFFKSLIITKPDEKLFALIKTNKKVVSNKRESVDIKELKKKSNVMLDINSEAGKPFRKDEFKEERREDKELYIKEPESIISLTQKTVKEKAVKAKTAESKAKSPKSRIDNPTIARLKQEALGKKSIEKVKINLPENDNEFDQQSEMTIEKLEKLNVHKLRHYARSFSGFPIKGREISRANREELLNHFKQLI